MHYAFIPSLLQEVQVHLCPFHPLTQQPCGVWWDEIAQCHSVNFLVDWGLLLGQMTRKDCCIHNLLWSTSWNCYREQDAGYRSLISSITVHSFILIAPIPSGNAQGKQVSSLMYELWKRTFQQFSSPLPWWAACPCQTSLSSQLSKAVTPCPLSHLAILIICWAHHCLHFNLEMEKETWETAGCTAGSAWAWVGRKCWLWQIRALTVSLSKLNCLFFLPLIHTVVG